jgi:hypothetical protein
MSLFVSLQGINAALLRVQFQFYSFSFHAARLTTTSRTLAAHSRWLSGTLGSVIISKPILIKRLFNEVQTH